MYDNSPKYPIPELSDSEIQVSKSKDGVVIQELMMIEDFYFPAVPVKVGKIPDPRKNVPAIRGMNMYDDDIIICAHQKAGTHWLWEMTRMLIKSKAEYDVSPKEEFMMEFMTPDKLDRIPRPRVLNTHLPVHMLPKQALEKKTKILFIQRNPKDVIVSLYNHNVKLYERLKGHWDECLTSFIQGFNSFGPWVTYTKSYEQYLLNHKDANILPLFYEELKKNPVGEIKRLANFLRIKADDSLATEIAEKCNFKNLRKADSDIKNKYMGLGSDVIYRKGEVGDWKNWFTVAQNEMFDEMLGKEMKDSTFKYTYTLDS